VLTKIYFGLGSAFVLGYAFTTATGYVTPVTERQGPPPPVVVQSTRASPGGGSTRYIPYSGGGSVRTSPGGTHSTWHSGSSGGK
jgi:hypothetical protein